MIPAWTSAAVPMARDSAASASRTEHKLQPKVIVHRREAVENADSEKTANLAVTLRGRVSVSPQGDLACVSPHLSPHLCREFAGLSYTRPPPRIGTSVSRPFARLVSATYQRTCSTCFPPFAWHLAQLNSIRSVIPILASISDLGNTLLVVFTYDQRQDSPTLDFVESSHRVQAASSLCESTSTHRSDQSSSGPKSLSA